jgi:carbamoyl-phosphate synthase small subunit
VNTVREVVESEKPVMGICLGNQLLGCAFGGHTFKLPFGHRGANHPVKDLPTGRVVITSQNHGYAIAPDSLTDPDVDITQINLNDGTVEGLQHRKLPVFSIQYHPEASPGPRDSTFYFERFVKRMEERK